MLEPWLKRFREGDRRALSRLLTCLSRGENVSEIRAALSGANSKPCLLAITGSAGVGKSSLIGKLVQTMRDGGKRIAVLACDPESPLTGGALLGDRIRMPSYPDDDGVFIRSFAVPGGRQGVAKHVALMALALGQFGFDWVIVETVGAGQGDTAIRSLADLVIVLVQPETGDDLQWEKAGLLEIADLVVVQKSDLPGAGRLEAQIREALNLAGNREIPVVRASAHKSHGIDDLWQAIKHLASQRLRQETIGR